MKKIRYLMCIFIVFLSFISINVFAFDEFVYSVNSDSKNSFTEGDFKYKNYNIDISYVEDTAILTIDSVTYLGNNKSPISFNLLLFDKKGKNIGLINYCSTKDKSSITADKLLRNGETTSIKLKLYDKYVPGFRITDIDSFYMMDSNKYCKIGGYDNYTGLTLDQILAGGSVGKQKYDFMKAFKNIAIVGILIGLIVSLAIYIVFGVIINSLHKAMYGKTTGLAYIPICNNYLCFKLAFGPTMAKLYLILYFVSIILVFFKILILTTLVSFFSFVAFILVIVKLITKKYDLFYFDPRVEKNNLQTFDNIVYNANNNSIGKQKNEYGYSEEDRVRLSLLQGNNQASIDDDSNSYNVNLNYSSSDNNSNDYFNISQGNMNNSNFNNNGNNFNGGGNFNNNGNNFNGGGNFNNNGNNFNGGGNSNNNNNNDGGSDLSNFFR